jgi:hypothetical protein
VVEHTAGIVEGFGHLDTAIDELGARCLDVGHDGIEALCRARHGRRDSPAEDDRARRSWGRKLHDPELVAPGEFGVEPPTQVAVKALGAIDVRNGDDDDLEFRRPGAKASSRLQLRRSPVVLIWLLWDGSAITARPRANP